MSTLFDTPPMQSTQFATTRKRLASTVRPVLDPKAIASRIKKAREDTGLTQDEFADLARVHKRTVGNWENAKEGGTPYKEMNQISELTGRSVRWLLHGDDWLSAEEWTEVHEIRAAVQELLSRPAPEPPGELGRRAANPQPKPRSQKRKRPPTAGGGSQGGEQ